MERRKKPEGGAEAPPPTNSSQRLIKLLVEVANRMGIPRTPPEGGAPVPDPERTPALNRQARQTNRESHTPLHREGAPGAELFKTPALYPRPPQPRPAELSLVPEGDEGSSGNSPASTVRLE